MGFLSFVMGYLIQPVLTISDISFAHLNTQPNHPEQEKMETKNTTNKINLFNLPFNDCSLKQLIKLAQVQTKTEDNPADSFLVNSSVIILREGGHFLNFLQTSSARLLLPHRAIKVFLLSLYFWESAKK